MGNDAFDLGDPRNRLIVALDFPDARAALACVDGLGESCRWFKVGMELFYGAGNSLLHSLLEREVEVFLDLKMHDIPTTVAAGVRSLAGCGAALMTVHAGGGPAMLEAAQVAGSGAGSPKLLGVTVLTSMDREQLNAVGVPGDPRAQVLRLARLADAAGLAGVVCSAEEVEAVRAELGERALLVVPGVRPVGTSAGDQKRTATPGEAIRRGASMLVVGRPITRAADPVQAAGAILREIEVAMRERRVSG